jgi:hypothetical protein
MREWAGWRECSDIRPVSSKSEGEQKILCSPFAEILKPSGCLRFSRASCWLKISSLFVVFLSLGLTAGCLLDLGFVLATGSGAGSLGGGLLAGGALDLLALDFIGDGGGVCHVFSFL